MFRARFATLLSITLLLSWVPVARAAQDHNQPTPLNLPKLETPLEIPSVLVQSLDQTKERLSGLIKRKAPRGPVFLHLWAPHCAPCLPEMRELERARPELERQGLIILTIAEDPDGQITVPAFIRRYSLSHTDYYVDDTRSLLHALGGVGVPATYLVSPEGKITAAQIGPLDWQIDVPAR